MLRRRSVRGALYRLTGRDVTCILPPERDGIGQGVNLRIRQQPFLPEAAVGGGGIRNGCALI